MKEKKSQWQQYIVLLFYILIGGLCGILMVSFINKMSPMSLWEELLWLFGLLAMMYVSILVQMITHEAGHLVFGLLSGYKFSSFRILNFMWVNESGTMRFRRLSIAGTGGQCLMSPPDLVDGKIPVILYNLGGSLVNAIAGLLFLGLFLLLRPLPFLSVSMLLFSVIGFMFAAMNGIPLRLGIVDNDGYNAYSLTRSSDAMRAFWIQMKVNEQITNGQRLKDMPEEWFSFPADRDMKNSMVAVIGVFACNRLMDQHRFTEADARMVHQLALDSGMVGLHRNLMICDRIYLELIGQNRQDVLDGFLSKEQQNFMKAMKTFPSVLRTQYAYALLAEDDAFKARSVAAKFEKYAKTYPYPHEVEAERELMILAEEKRKT